MSRRFGSLGAVGLMVCLGLTLKAQQTSPTGATTSPVIEKISGPYTHANLSIFLLHGKDTVNTRKFITLNEAMEQKKIVVHETSDVNMLAVENTSDDVEVFIQSGDIVKGSKQDRLISFDMLLPPRSGRVPIPSFCVEAGRWSQRGQENPMMFGSNSAQAGKSLKLAANSGLSGAQGSAEPGRIMANPFGGGRSQGQSSSMSRQSEVWDKVKEAQLKLQKTVNKNLMASQSPSSYQLTLEDKALLDKLALYEKELAGTLAGKNDVIGIAYAVNGKVEGAEVFACSALCAKQWTKMLKSCTVDGLADLDDKKKFSPATIEQVDAFLKLARGPMKEIAQARDAMAQQQSSNTASSQAPQADAKPNPIRMFQCEQKESLLLESREKGPTGAVLHQSYLRKDPPK